jgi:transposase
MPIKGTGGSMLLRNDEFELKDYCQDSCEESLLKHLRIKYPGVKCQVLYVAGFCGFGMQRSLEKSDLHGVIINPADPPSSEKDKKRKNDRIDARKKSRELSNGVLKGIYVPAVEMELARTLVRQRCRTVQDQTSGKLKKEHLKSFIANVILVKMETL